jgi:(1->4)-alpha-D-glucan 1-alpha-D-glucosylmutase
VDPDTEYLLWQTLVGAWPLSGYRLTGYLTKAMREAKRRTSWTDPDAEYESAVLSLAAQILGDAELSASIGAFVQAFSGDAMVNSLGVKLVQLTMPGVADIYQGCELAGLSLVDPDNRRPVDYARRRRLLASLDADDDGAGESLSLDSAKLLVTSRALRLRRAHPEWFTGDSARYQPLAAEGPEAEHVMAFLRGGALARGPGAITVATRLPVGLRRRGGWTDTALTLPDPEAAWRDVLTSRLHQGKRVPLSELTSRLPVALLVPEGL